jgi:tripartite-type tricarboxylate transporter receptor subunit TctC
MKKLFKAGVAAALLAVTSTASMAEDWTPPGPIKLMIAFAAGGGADTQARMIAEELENRLGWTFIPEQVTGKGGLNLAAALKDQPNDGTAIGMAVTETFGYNMAAAETGMMPSDFTGITTTAGFQMAVVALKSSGWTTFEDVVAAAKGGQNIRFGTMSAKLSDLVYLLGKAQGVEFNDVSVRGGKAVMNGLNAGDMDVGIGAGIQAKAVAAGDMVELASFLPGPLAMTPDAPTLADLGVPFDAAGQFMFVAPAGLPTEARDAMAAAIADIITDPSTKAGGLIKKAFGGPVIIAGDDLTKELQAGYDSAGALIKAASE